jgi:hypothetical protein
MSKPKTIFQLVGEYANAVGRHGPDSDEVRRFRADHADNEELLAYADALDRIKRHFSGESNSLAPHDMPDDNEDNPISFDM